MNKITYYHGSWKSISKIVRVNNEMGVGDRTKAMIATGRICRCGGCWCCKLDQLDYRWRRLNDFKEKNRNISINIPTVRM